MMDDGRTIRRIELDRLGDADRFFRRISRIDPGKPKKRYEDALNRARELVASRCRISLVCKRVAVTSRDSDGLLLAGGERLAGSVLLEAFEDAGEVVCFVIALHGFEDIPSESALVDYFCDVWSSAYAECAQAAFASALGGRLAGEHRARTHLWCPGMHGVDLCNQRAIFDLLRPEDIGCTLTEGLLMVPVKASSGVVGIVGEGAACRCLPCTRCAYRESCPAQDNPCPVI